MIGIGFVAAVDVTEESILIGDKRRLVFLLCLGIVLHANRSLSSNRHFLLID